MSDGAGFSPLSVRTHLESIAHALLANECVDLMDIGRLSSDVVVLVTRAYIRLLELGIRYRWNPVRRMLGLARPRCFGLYNVENSGPKCNDRSDFARVVEYPAMAGISVSVAVWNTFRRTKRSDHRRCRSQTNSFNMSRTDAA